MTAWIDATLSTISKAMTGLLEPAKHEDAVDFPSNWFMGADPDVANWTQQSAATQTTVKPVSASRWMSTYENGEIPLSAMTQIPGGGYLRPDVAAAFMDMVNAAKAEGVKITVGAGGAAYRTLAIQQTLVKQKGLYNQGGYAAAPGTSPHGWGIAVDVGLGAQREWLADHADEYGFHTIAREPWHWEYDGKYQSSSSPLQPPKPKAPKEQREFSMQQFVSNPRDTLPSSLFVLFENEAAAKYGKTPSYVTNDTSSLASVKRQLWQGFMDAGRADLARAVYTRDFETWVKAESGWNPSIVSQYYSGHGRNAGLFQFALLDRGWVWDDVKQGNQWTYLASPYQQAQYVAKYFGALTPEKIKQYAAEIRAGDYNGWP